MKKCLTERESLIINQENNNKALTILSDNKNNSKLIPKIKIKIPFNRGKKYYIINKNFQKRMKANITNNYLNTISNLENTSPNTINNLPINIHNLFGKKIYQKKKIPFPHKIKETNNKNKINLKQYKKMNIHKSIQKDKIKKNLNIKSGTLFENSNNNKNKLNIDKLNLDNINNLKNTKSNDNYNQNKNKINDIDFLKKLNFDQPHNYSFSEYKTLVNNKSNRTIPYKSLLLNKRSNYKGNYLIKNETTNKNMHFKMNDIKRKSQNKILSNNINNINQKKIKCMNLIAHSESKKAKNATNSKNISKKPSKSKNKNQNKNTNINININTIINNNTNKNYKKKEKLETNNLITSESFTILDNSISEINSFINESNDITQLESEKDEQNVVLSTHQLNLYLNMAKRFHQKNNNNTIIKPKKKKLELNNILFSSINTNFKINLIKFLDKKSLLILSSINKKFFTNLRNKLYKYFYDKIIKNNGNKDFIIKILTSIQKYSNNKIKYEFYLKNKSLYDTIIIQDLLRTFPNENNFGKNTNNYKKLYNILTAYSNFNKNIGYAQGMNFIAARAITIFKNEEKVFEFLDGLINRFNLGYLISINNQKLPNQIKYFSHILNKYCNVFINYLKSKLVSPDFFCTSWLITLFSNSMDKKKLYICWCFIIIFGWKFFYSFVIQVISFYEKSLIKINETRLSKQMKDLLKTNDFLRNFNQIIKNTLIFMENNIIL